MLEMNSHSTNPGKGSKRTDLGARVFQSSHVTVQPRMTRKKPMVPTWVVIQSARRLSGVARTGAGIMPFALVGADFSSVLAIKVQLSARTFAVPTNLLVSSWCRRFADESYRPQTSQLHLAKALLQFQPRP